jgi:hypothetical protein
MDDQRDLAWKAASLLAAIGAATATRKALEASWKAATGRDVPENPADRRTPWAQALVWAAGSGALVGVTRMVADHWAARGWEQALDEAPPGLRTGSTTVGDLSDGDMFEG